MDQSIQKPVDSSDVFKSNPPSKISTYAQAVLIIAYYVGLDLGLAMLIMIKHVKDNWPVYKCSTWMPEDTPTATTLG